jgi:hypothetical protein
MPRIRKITTTPTSKPEVPDYSTAKTYPRIRPTNSVLKQNRQSMRPAAVLAL